MQFDWSDLGVAIGLVLLFEGAAYALFPDAIRRLMAIALTQPVPALRAVGALVAATGLVVVWMIRG